MIYAVLIAALLFREVTEHQVLLSFEVGKVKKPARVLLFDVFSFNPLLFHHFYVSH